ncbi:MAG: FkbM family methyltransferase [Verrucomicrobiaceae bacterium]|nr:FkbM family methyltransferase [Verrucomicrobiaceae bacterium]
MSLSHQILRARAYLLDKLFIKQPWLRRLVTQCLYGTGDHEVQLFGTRLKVNALRENGYLRADRLVKHSSLWRDEVSLLMTLSHLVQAGDTFVDVGANIGVFCCSLARLPGVKVIAFEANPETYKRLQANAAVHGVDARCMAISDKAGELEFCDGAVSHVFAEVSHRNDYHLGGSTVKVKAMPLDDVLSGQNRLVIKVDVEGHEPQVLRGAERLIESGAVKAVVLDASKEARTASQWLEGKGFKLVDPLTYLPPSASTGVFVALKQ